MQDTSHRPITPLKLPVRRFRVFTLYIYIYTIIRKRGMGAGDGGGEYSQSFRPPPSSTNDDFHHKTAPLDEHGLAVSLSRSPADHDSPISVPFHPAFGDSSLACNPGSHRQWRQSMCLCGAKGSMDSPCPRRNNPVTPTSLWHPRTHPSIDQSNGRSNQHLVSYLAHRVNISIKQLAHRLKRGERMRADSRA